MTDDDLAEGCGISPVITGKKDPFYAACAWHDTAYLNGSRHQTMFNRDKIDEQFYSQMLEIAGTSVLLRMRAWFYYRLARLFGSKFWEGQ